MENLPIHQVDLPAEAAQVEVDPLEAPRNVRLNQQESMYV
jgi:hypothetical protein